jgi:transcriptional antiterminator RfaH
MADWYVLQTKVRHEAVAEHNLNNQSFNTFLPMLRVQRHIRGKWQSLNEPLFPGYLFVELDLEKQNTAPIRSTRGVICLVRMGSTLQPFPITLLEALKCAQITGGDVIDAARMFEPGEEVRILSGPLDGVQAIFKARNSQERVILLLNILGTETQVNMSPHQIAKVG